MIVFIETWVGWCVLSALSTTVFAGFGQLLGIPIREVSFGFGRRMVSFGRYNLRLWPGGSKVVFAYTADDDYQPTLGRKAFNLQPAWKQIALILSGPIALFAFAVLILGRTGIEQFGSGLWEIVVGAISPFSKAQAFLAAYVHYVRSNAFLFVVAVLAAKMAALEMLPILPSGGGRALMILVGSMRQPETSRSQPLPIWLLIPLLIICMGWTLAIGYAAWQAA